MQKRAYGFETEYSVAIKGKDGGFYTGAAPEDRFGSPSSLFFGLFSHRDRWPEGLNELFFHPKKKMGSSYFLGSNGAKFYFDNASVFPEYATPECANVRSALLHMLAGDTVMNDLRKLAVRDGLFKSAYEGKGKDICVVRINTSFKEDQPGEGYSTGGHENYLVSRTISGLDATDRMNAGKFIECIVPFLMTRQIFDGAGGIRWNGRAKQWEYVLSQRAFFIESKFSQSTSNCRGFLGFKQDLNESPPDMARLQVFSGDLTMSQFGKYIAMAATHLVVRACEENSSRTWRNRASGDDWKQEMRELAGDITLQSPITIFAGKAKKHYKATDVQRLYVEFVIQSLRSFSSEERAVLGEWIAMLDRLDQGFEAVSRELDWAIKYAYFLKAFGGDVSSPKARFANFLYHDISERGIYNRFLANGRVEHFAPADEIQKARLNPPPTRAEFRSRFIKTLARFERDPLLWCTWGMFSGPKKIVAISDPLARTTAEAEHLLRQLNEMCKEEMPSPQASMNPEDWHDGEDDREVY